MPDRGPRVAGFSLLAILIAGVAGLLSIKLWLAAILDLYSDEVFYWQASTLPAVAYSDLPFMTSLLAGLGPIFADGSSLAVRLPFILLGSSLPLLMFWLARPLVGRQQALLAAVLTLCLPPAGFLGLLAVPDVPLILFGLLTLGFFERALRTDRLSCWIATGVCAALGLSTHYRFLLYPAAALLFLCCFPSARFQWRNPRLWLALLIASTGLIPVIWFNLSHELASVGFYFIDRHPWQFQAAGLLHVFKQALLVTPPLYAVFAVTLWRMLRGAREGNPGAALLLSFASLTLFTYLVLAPWTDANSTSIHWPLFGYFPLLVFAPETLRWLWRLCADRWNVVIARRIIAVAPLVGFAGTLVAFIGIGSQAFQQPLQSLVGRGVLSTRMAGWQEFASHTASVIDRHFTGVAPVIVTGNYYTAAQVEFAGLTPAALTLDQDKAVRDGRLAQYRLWRRDESGLAELAGRPLLYINEDSSLTLPEKHALMDRMCRYGEPLQYLDELTLFNGDKRYSFYKAARISDAGAGSRSQPCPFPPRSWIDQPLPGARLSGMATISGWAYNEDIGVDEIHLLIDGRRAGAIHYGLPREDVVVATGVATDPNSPRLGFELEFDTRNFADGRHELAIEIINGQGATTIYWERSIRIANQPPDPRWD